LIGEARAEWKFRDLAPKKKLINLENLYMQKADVFGSRFKTKVERILLTISVGILLFASKNISKS